MPKLKTTTVPIPIFVPNSENDYITRRNRPKAILDEEEYKRELNYVIKKTKQLVNQLGEMPFNHESIKKYFNEFVIKESYDFNKEVRLINQKSSYDFIRSRYQYEYGNGFSWDPEVDKPICGPSGDRYSSLLSDERIRLTTTYFYFKVVVDIAPRSYDNKKGISVAIYDIVKSDLIDYVFSDGINIWLDKGITQYTFLKEIVHKSLNNEDFSQTLSECQKIFGKSKTKYRLGNINDYYKEKQCPEVKTNSESQQQ